MAPCRNVAVGRRDECVGKRDVYERLVKITKKMMRKIGIKCHTCPTFVPLTERDFFVIITIVGAVCTDKIKGDKKWTYFIHT